MPRLIPPPEAAPSPSRPGARVLQWGSAQGTSSCSPSLPHQPAVGNMLVAIQLGVQMWTSSSEVSVSGGGVFGRWVPFGRGGQSSGQQACAAAWYCFVGATPSASISLGYPANKGVGHVIEIANATKVLTKFTSTSVNSATGSSMTMTTPNTDPGGIVLAAFLARESTVVIGTPGYTLLRSQSTAAGNPSGETKLVTKLNNGAGLRISVSNAASNGLAGLVMVIA